MIKNSSIVVEMLKFCSCDAENCSWILIVFTNCVVTPIAPTISILSVYMPPSIKIGPLITGTPATS